MIAKLEGLLETIDEGHALVAMPGGLTLEVLLPNFAAARLGGSIGQQVTLHTMLFLEGQAQGTTLVPRLAGFITQDDRAFYQLFVTCKGIGHRRALRAMTLGTAQIATAIADRDLATLQSLPEIGKRTAETIVASLRGKVDRFASAPSSTTGNGQATDGSQVQAPSGGLARETLEVLTQLGENRTQAITWIDEVLAQDDAPADVQGVLQEVYRLKAGG